MGTNLDITYAENHGPPMIPIAITVQFDDNGYVGSTFCKDIPMFPFIQ